jgi:hypothetical protein
MLTHQTIGPTNAGRDLVAYLTPGCAVPTVACDCSSRDQADAETKRLNAAQRAREVAIKCERAACGLTGAHPGLGGN